MGERIRPREFQAAEGASEWRVLGEGACTLFRTDSFEDSVRLVSAIGALPAIGDRRPDLDLRANGVTVRLITIRDGSYGLTTDDLAMARAISQIAREHGATADPSAVQTVQVTIDALSIPTVLPFWRAVLGYRDRDDGGEDLIDPNGRNAPFWFQQMEEPRTDRNRIHLDVWIPREQAEERIAAALAAGGRLVSDAHAPSWWTLADPEGNEVDLGTTTG